MLVYLGIYNNILGYVIYKQQELLTLQAVGWKSKSIQWQGSLYLIDGAFPCFLSTWEGLLTSCATLLGTPISLMAQILRPQQRVGQCLRVMTVNYHHIIYAGENKVT